MMNMVRSETHKEEGSAPALEGIVYFGALGFGWKLNPTQLDEYAHNVRQMVMERLQQLRGGGF